jgi:hypothetical protein
MSSAQAVGKLSAEATMIRDEIATIRVNTVVLIPALAGSQPERLSALPGR